MKKLTILASAGLIALGTVGAAQAQSIYHGGGYGYGGHHHSHYRHHNGFNGGGLAAGLIGGAILGGVLSAATAPAYAAPVASYGYYGAPAYYGYDEPVVTQRVVYAAPRRVVRQRVVYAAPRRVVRQRVVYSTPRTVIRNRVAVRQAFPFAARHEVRNGYRTVQVGSAPSRRVIVSPRAY